MAHNLTYMHGILYNKCIQRVIFNNAPLVVDNDIHSFMIAAHFTFELALYEFGAIGQKIVLQLK